MSMEQERIISFYCCFENGGRTKHRQQLRIEDIPRWIEAYLFTHPTVASISVKLWTKEDSHEADE